MHLHEALARRVAQWRADGYPHARFPAIAEILAYQTIPAPDGLAGAADTLRFLRLPQLRALETYWYLRLVEGTPRVVDLYRRLFPETTDFLDALGLSHRDLVNIVVNHGLDALLARIREDDDFVRTYKLEAVRETLTLAYPSYILALAMGAGKTILIGAIIATEFAMAQEYPDADFVQNALVFAPGKTIIEALRELAEVPYDLILPPRMYGGFAAAVSLTFTRDGAPDIPVIPGSLFNIVVTNTEKIRIQKEAVRKSDLGSLFSARAEDEARREVANLRLRRIASLPHLAVFSDEAHHTYGQSLLGKWTRDPETGESVFREAGIKKVRRTVDYLAENTNVLCVVNTTGTPYFQRQPLKDVVIWYGLSQGIRDGILKDVEGNIYAYDYDDAAAADLVREIVTDFFRDYGDVRLPDGAPAKLALYFPQTDDLAELRPAVEAALAAAGQPATIVLRNTSESPKEEVDAFNRLNDPRSPHRVILLVNKGTEGWNCPSLFACALLRNLKKSNNFVLQAATRCLRQVPGNTRPARIYLSRANQSILDRQLQETYGESLRDLEHTPRERGTATLQLRKYRMPPVCVTRTVRTVVRVESPGAQPLRLERPVVPPAEIERITLTLANERATRRVLRAAGEAVSIDVAGDALDVRSAAVELASNYHADVWPLYDELARLYPEGEVPLGHLPALGEQIERQTRSYTVKEERVDVALALVRLDPRTGEPDPRGWRRTTREDGEVVYTAEIAYYKDRADLLLRLSDVRGLEHDLGFHYDPYDFDSRPERDFFTRVLRELDEDPGDVEDVYFTGALTDPGKTEFFVEYLDEKGRWRRYSPDFLIRRRDGRCVIVEVKAERDREHPIHGERGRKAMKLHEWEELNPEQLRYRMVFTRDDVVPMDAVTKVLRSIDLGAQPRAVRPLAVPEALLREFGEKWGVAKLELFGSVARGEDRPDSDVDVLVTFKDGVEVGWDIVEMERELADVLGRPVDLVPRKAVEESDNPIRRRSILENARPIYTA